ncbi:TonB-dependent receptor [Parapedobacter pyrenivorans]|uniref:TonB-dependent receptor n=1 Tax=Parapedobacter pyrenivorans TaxID=1305674 RepID=UPI00334074D1
MKNYDFSARGLRAANNQLFRVMKVTAFLLLIGCMHLSAATMSQTVTLRAQKESLRQVFRVVEKQTGYGVVFNDNLISKSKPVTIDARNMALTRFLEQVLESQGLTYDLDGYTILIKPAIPQANLRNNGPGAQAKAPAVVQQRTVQGKVTDPYGAPLGSVTVTQKNTQNRVVTNNDGTYQISLQGEDITLVFSMVGFIDNEQPVGNRSVVDVVLAESISDLDEVVVVGYGTVRKSDLTGAVSSVKSEEINAFPTSNVMNALSGRAPGVQVKQNTGAPGGAVSVRIRGTNSIQGSNEPLYVIDGFPVSGQPLHLNNNDIESIEILKDASAVAIYGSRGANGVVMITTKSGKDGKMRVDYESNFGSQSLRKKLDLMNATEYATFYNILAESQDIEPYYTQEEINNLGTGFDWQDFVYRNAPIQNHSLGFSGGNSKTQYSVGGSIFGQNGIIKGSDYNRYSLRTNINHQISDKFKAAVSTTLSRNTTSRQNSGGGIQGQSLISASMVAPPTLTPYNDDGTYRVLELPLPIIVINPLNFINETFDDGVSNKVLANASLSYEPIKGLVFKVYGGIENSDDRNDYYRTLNFFNADATATVTTAQFTSLVNENTVTYSTDFGARHSLVALGGFTYQDFINKGLGGSGRGFLSDATESYNLASATVPGIPNSSFSKSVLLSYLGRLNYSFDNRFLVTLSFRSDGSSKYSEGNKWGFFPSGAVAWKLKEEAFLKDNNAISDLKIRASWGRTGSQAINAYATLNQLSSGKTVFGDVQYNTFAPTTTLPGDLRWETTEQTDIGIDLAVLHNRLQITADYYNKTTFDLLNSVQLPSSMGFRNTIRNVGTIRNRGLEFAANAGIFNNTFKWNLAGNIAFNKSKVMKLYGGQEILTGAVGVLIFQDNITMLREGEPMGVFYGYKEIGYDENGFVKYQDTNNDGVINLNDKMIVGDPNPKFVYGINSHMSFKGFDLTLFLQGTKGNDIANISKIGNTLHYSWGMNLLREALYDHWTPENTNAKYPAVDMFQSVNFSNRFIEDGSYLRLRNIELGYTFPMINSSVPWIQSAKLYISGQNLLTFTNYSWMDPDVNSSGGSNSVTQGIDFSTYPVAKSYLVGVRIGF